MLMLDLDFTVALGQSGLSSATLIRLVEVFGSSKAVWQALEADLTPHVNEKQLAKLVALRRDNQPEQIKASYDKLNIEAISYSHSEFPELLRMIPDPPFVLYVRGNKTLLHQKSLAVVGTRRYTDYGRRVVNQLIDDIAAYGPCVISGLAVGIDTLAHQAALAHHLPTLAVFGTGIDNVYPKQNERLAQEILDSGGALISEYPLGMPGEKHTFPQRNRIISGLSMGTLVIEGDPKSGALITARHALDQNRQVMAVPGNIFSAASAGPNQLIQQGAASVTCANDIVQALNWSENRSVSLKSQQGLDFSQAYENLSPQVQNILKSVGYEPTLLDEIRTRLPEVSIVDLQVALTMLELQGLVTALPGTKFCRN